MEDVHARSRPELQRMDPVTVASYPPERHAIRDLDITTLQPVAERSLALSPVTDAVRNRAGGAALGFIAAVVDVGAALVALVAGQPDWTVTADMSLHSVAPLTAGPALIDCRLVRAGSNIVVVATDVYDTAGITDLDELTDVTALARAVTGLVTFARIPARASVVSDTFDPAGRVGTQNRMGPDTPIDTPLLERIGLQSVDAAGAVEVENSEYVSNSVGTVNGGVLGMVFQGAAEAAVPDAAAVDLQIHYLAQARQGPVRTKTTIVRRVDDHAVCSIAAVDAGDDDRLLALATVTLQTIRA